MDKSKCDGEFVNATEICRKYKKDFQAYYKRPETRKFIKELMNETNSREAELITQKGPETWVHPQIALHLAQWVSPKLAIELMRQFTNPATTLKRVMDSTMQSPEPTELSQFDMALKKALEFNPRK